MNRIDRYIFVLFIRVFAICLVCLTGLIIVVDLFTNLDDFIDAGRKQGSLPKLLIAYYTPLALSLFTRLCPFFCLLALLFAVSWLKRTSELTALLAAGVPKRRVLRWPLLGAVALLVVSTALRETVIPHFQDALGKRPQDLTGDNYRPLRPTLDPSTGVLINGRHVEVLNRRIDRPLFRLGGPSADIAGQVTANEAIFEEANAEHPAGFRLIGVTSDVATIVDRPEAAEARKILFLPEENGWLAPGELFIASQVDFELLQGNTNWAQYDSTVQIIKRLRSQPTYYGANVRLRAHCRLTQPLLDASLILFGLPVVLRRIEKNLFAIAASVTGKVLAFTLVVLAIQAVAGNTSYLPIFTGAWLPLLVIFPYAWADSQSALLS